MRPETQQLIAAELAAAAKRIQRAERERKEVVYPLIRDLWQQAVCLLIKEGLDESTTDKAVIHSTIRDFIKANEQTQEQIGAQRDCPIETFLGRAMHFAIKPSQRPPSSPSFRPSYRPEPEEPSHVEIIVDIPSQTHLPAFPLDDPDEPFK
jgi:hypothetical protein